MRRSLRYLTFWSLLIIFVITGWGLFIWQSRESAQVTAANGDLIRLHVLANSDAAFDQQLKLEVRDAIIAYLSPYLQQVSSASEARQIIEQHREPLLNLAQKIIDQAGASYKADLQTGMFEFPIKAYGSLVLPAGKYEAVRILIGQAEGKNWWCVLFPPLCFVDGTQVTALTNASEATVAKNQSSTIQFRSKIAEWWNKEEK